MLVNIVEHKRGMKRKIITSSINMATLCRSILYIVNKEVITFLEKGTENGGEKKMKIGDFVIRDYTPVICIKYKLV